MCSVPFPLSGTGRAPQFATAGFMQTLSCPGRDTLGKQKQVPTLTRVMSLVVCGSPSRFPSVVPSPAWVRSQRA